MARFCFTDQFMSDLVSIAAQHEAMLYEISLGQLALLDALKEHLGETVPNLAEKHRLLRAQTQELQKQLCHLERMRKNSRQLKQLLSPDLIKRRLVGESHAVEARPLQTLEPVDSTVELRTPVIPAREIIEFACEGEADRVLIRWNGAVWSIPASDWEKAEPLK